MAFLTGWSHRKPITISRASGAVTNYQMKLRVGETNNIASDDFMRADENPLNASVWSTPTNFTAMRLVSNAMQGTGTGWNISYYSGVTFSANQWSEVYLPVLSAPDNAGPAVRCSNSGVYLIDANRSGTKTCQIYRRNGTTWTAIGTDPGASLSSSAGILRLEIAESTLRIYDAGVLIYTVTDSSPLSSGGPGAYMFQNSHTLEAWAGGDCDISCGGLSKTDFSDLRFTKADGATLLDYWIESVSGATPNQLATVWIEFDSIGTGATDFYMYYGNAGASAVSSGANTFIFFDDFSGASLDTTVRWDLIAGSSPTLSGGIATLGSGTEIRSKVAFPTNRRFRSSSNFPANNAYAVAGFHAAANYSAIFHTHFPTGNVLNISTRNPYPTQTSVNLGNNYHNAWNIFEVLRNASTNVLYYISGAPVGTISATVPTIDLPAELYGLTQALYSDWVFVSQYLATEPAWGARGAQEDAPVGEGGAVMNSHFFVMLLAGGGR